MSSSVMRNWWVAAVRRLLDKAYTVASGVVIEHGLVPESMAHALLRWETPQGNELERACIGELHQ
jgi:ATP-dependent Zn protease